MFWVRKYGRTVLLVFSYIYPSELPVFLHFILVLIYAFSKSEYFAIFDDLKTCFKLFNDCFLYQW